MTNLQQQSLAARVFIGKLREMERVVLHIDQFKMSLGMMLAPVLQATPRRTSYCTQAYLAFTALEKSMLPKCLQVNECIVITVS